MKLDQHTLIGKYLSGNISGEEQQQLNKWLDIDPSHRRELEEATKLWSISAKLNNKTEYNTEQAWEEFGKLAQAEPKIKKLYLQPLKIAAGLALIVSTVLVLRFFLSEPENDSILVHEQIQILTAEPAAAAQVEDTFSIPASGTKAQRAKPMRQLAMTTINSGDSVCIYQLPDGSKVYLNKNSSLAYSGNGRNIRLDGEAFFEIKPDTLPFYVTCKSTVARTTGTSFNIKGYSEDSGVEIMVLTGQVEVMDTQLESNKIQLSAGDFVSCGKDQSFVKTKIGKKDKWWKKGGLKFRIRKFFNKIKEKLN